MENTLFASMYCINILLQEDKFQNMGSHNSSAQVSLLLLDRGQNLNLSI